MQIGSTGTCADGPQARRYLRNDRAGKRATGAAALGASTAASANCSPLRSTADPLYVEAVLALASRRSCLACRCGSQCAWDQRHKIAGYDGRCIPAAMAAAAGFTLDKALVYGFMRQESAFNPKARSYVGAMG